MSRSDFSDNKNKLFMYNPQVPVTNKGNQMVYNLPRVVEQKQNKTFLLKNKVSFSSAKMLNESNGEVYKLAEEKIIMKKPNKSENRLFWFLKKGSAKTSSSKKLDSCHIQTKLEELGMPDKNRDESKKPVRSKSFETNSSLR